MTRRILTSLIGVALAVALPSIALAGRNASGTFSVNPGAGTWPFVTGTSINSTTMNSIFSDFSTTFTDSLSRSGKGAMQAPLACTDGSASFPSITFNNELTSGWYRIGTNDVGLSINGVKRWEHNTLGQIETGWLQVAGTVTVASTLSVTGAASVGPLTLTSTITGLTRQGLPTVGQQVSTSSGTFSTASNTAVDVTNLSVTITTSGRPVLVMLESDGNAAGALGTNTAGASLRITFLRDASVISDVNVFAQIGIPDYKALTQIPPSILKLDTPPAGTYTYKVQAWNSAVGTGSVYVTNAQLAVFEL